MIVQRVVQRQQLPDDLLRQLIDGEHGEDGDDLDRPRIAARIASAPVPAAQPAAAMPPDRWRSCGSFMPPATPRPRRCSGRTARRYRGSTTPRRRSASSAAHFSPSARPTSIASVSSLPPRLQRDLRHDEQHRQVVAIAARAARRSRRPRVRTTRAPSELPIVLPWRADLERPVHLVADRRSAAASAPRARRRPSAATEARGGNSARWTDASRGPGRCRHISSAVTGRIGASSRASPSAMMYIARLRRAALRRSGGERIQAILRDVGVERRQVDRRQLVDALEDRRESRSGRRRRGSRPPSSA